MSAPNADEPEDGTGPGPVAAHALAYAELVTALLHAWQRTLARQVLGAVMALGGLTAVTLLLTVAAVAAAWPTPSRWVVLFAVAGLYLVFAGIGMWLVLRRPPVASPAAVLVAELRKDVHQLSAALRRSPP